MPFSPMQKEYFKNATHRWNVKSGATRSGKTHMDYYLIPKRLRAVSGKDGLSVLMGNTRGTLTRNIIEPLQNIWGSRLVSSIRSDNTAVLFGEKVFCLGADKVTQVDRLRGSSIKYCYGDEVVTWNEEVFSMLKSRLDKPYSMFDGTYNPEGRNHWFKAFLDSKADIYRQDYTIYDNPFLSSEFVSALETEYAGTVYFDRYIKGLWVNAEGLVYSMFREDVHIVAREQVERLFLPVYYVSCDYGTLNATVFLLWHKLSDGRWYLEKEYYYSGRKEIRNKTDSEYADDLERFLGGNDVMAMIVDPSAASFIAELKKRNVRVLKARNDVLDGIRYTSSLLNQNRIMISPSCKETINEFSCYRWDESKLEDTGIKDNDHCMDAMRYFAYTVLDKRKVGTRKITL